MTSPIENGRSPWVSFLAHLFVILVAWTIFIKYMFPIGFALAIGMSVVEILIITTLFIWFLAEPGWSIWRTNWFVNKVFVLAAFVLVLGTAVFRPEALAVLKGSDLILHPGDVGWLQVSEDGVVGEIIELPV